MGRQLLLQNLGFPCSTGKQDFVELLTHELWSDRAARAPNRAQLAKMDRLAEGGAAHEMEPRPFENDPAVGVRIGGGFHISSPGNSPRGHDKLAHGRPFSGTRPDRFTVGVYTCRGSYQEEVLTDDAHDAARYQNLGDWERAHLYRVLKPQRSREGSPEPSPREEELYPVIQRSPRQSELQAEAAYHAAHSQPDEWEVEAEAVARSQSLAIKRYRSAGALGRSYEDME